MSVEEIAQDRKVQKALRDYAKVRNDFDDFDGDRRGIAEHLMECESEVIPQVLKAAGLPNPTSADL